MNNSGSKTSVMASTYGHNTTVESLTRIHRVTGSEYPVSGDAKLRMQYRLLDVPAKSQRKVSLWKR